MGKDECSHLANVMSAALTPFFNSHVGPPEHNRRLQGEPYGFSGVSRSFHPLPQPKPLEFIFKGFDVNRKAAPERPQEAECPFTRRHLSGVIEPVCLPTQHLVQKSGSARYKNLMSSRLLPDSRATTDATTLE
jgi:hypothetical protein